MFDSDVSNQKRDWKFNSRSILYRSNESTSLHETKKVQSLGFPTMTENFFFFQRKVGSMGFYEVIMVSEYAKLYIIVHFFTLVR